MARGYPQRGVLTPLLWSLVVDELTGLKGNDYYTLAGANDFAILISGKFPNTFSQLLHDALNRVQ